MTEDKFILMNMDDERSGHIAEVLKNPTCKKMLNYLGDVKEASEKDISDALKMPINTVEYNLNKLIKSGLVDKTKNFFWSVKGKKIPMYKLARKHIIISPSKKPDMNYIRSIIPVILIAVVLIAILSSIYLFPKQGGVTSGQEGMMRFASQEDLTDFIKDNANANANVGYYGRGDIMIEANAPMAADTAAGATKSSSESASSYSTTNIQMQGVDEADIVKNDGKYIYIVSGDKIKIVDAYPAEGMSVLSEINVGGVSNIYINNNKLIAFANDYSPVLYSKEMALSSVRCIDCGYGGLVSLVYVYDIKDRENPKLESNFSFEGNYVDSRMIDDYVYIVSTKYASVDNPQPPIYYANGIERKVTASDVYYWPYSDSSYIFTSISAIDLDDNKVSSEVYLTGSTSTIFVSQDNIYLTYRKTVNYKEYAERMAEIVYYPILPSEYDSKIKMVLDSDKNDWAKLSEMQTIVNEYSNTLKGEEFSDFSKELQDNLEEFNTNIQKEIEKTVVHKINVNGNEINYEGVGEVPGQVLNQFSMDEYKGNFRIATTTGNWRDTSLNHLYVLDEDLKIVGSVEDLAKGEKIYSVRFIGEKAYMVTFRQVDPLYVIDVGDARNPKVLGYLKIPGYSDYLHPYDKNHIIGIGKSATEEGRVQGMKIALFDVSDVKNPVEKAKIEIGSRGTNSPALYDHKAFLFDKSGNLLVIPIQVYEEKQMGNEFTSSVGSDIVFNGAYVFNIDLNGIDLRGKISHFDSKSKYGAASEDEIGAKREVYGQVYIKIAKNSWEINQTYDYPRVYYDYYKTIYSDEYMDQQQGGIKYNNLYDYQYQIQRSLYMDDVLYTVSNSKIKANDLQSVNEINSLDLGYNQDFPIYY